MRASIKIPKGWRRLGFSEIMREGDRYLHTVSPGEFSWELVNASIGLAPEGQMIVIRKKVKRQKLRWIVAHWKNWRIVRENRGPRLLQKKRLEHWNNGKWWDIRSAGDDDEIDLRKKLGQGL